MIPPNSYTAPNGDLHINLGPQAANPDSPATAAMCAIDAAADRKWLAEHPEADKRVRPSSIREMTALNLPAGSVTVTTRGPHGSQIRAFIDG